MDQRNFFRQHKSYPGPPAQDGKNIYRHYIIGARVQDLPKPYTDKDGNKHYYFQGPKLWIIPKLDNHYRLKDWYAC